MFSTFEFSNTMVDRFEDMNAVANRRKLLLRDILEKFNLLSHLGGLSTEEGCITGLLQLNAFLKIRLHDLKKTVEKFNTKAKDSNKYTDMVDMINKRADEALREDVLVHYRVLFPLHGLIIGVLSFV